MALASPTPPAGDVLNLLRLPEVKRRTGKSRSDIYRAIASGRFPRPIKIGDRASAWLAAEVDSWIVSRVAERDGRPQS